MGFVSCAVRMRRKLIKLTGAQEKTIIKVCDQFQASGSITEVTTVLTFRRSIEVTNAWPLVTEYGSHHGYK